MAYISVSGKNIYYEVYGEEHNAALVYLHGGPGASCLDFAAQAKELGRAFKVVIFDQWGVLRSDPIMADEAYGMDRQVAMIEEMREKLHIPRWSVLGHSYGGMLACLYAHTFPASVDKLILDCPSLDFIDSARSTADYLTDYISGTGDDEAKALLDRIKTTDYTDTAVVFDLLALLGHVQDMQLRNYLHGITYDEYAQIACSADPIPAEMWARAETHLMKLIDDGKLIDHYLPMLSELPHPLLLIHGRYDPACSKNQIRYIAENVKGAKQVLFENSGHFPRIEEPAKYTRCVLEFLTAS